MSHEPGAMSYIASSPVVKRGGDTSVFARSPDGWFMFNGIKIRNFISKLDFTILAEMVNYFGIRLGDKVLEAGVVAFPYTGLLCVLNGAEADFVQPDERGVYEKITRQAINDFLYKANELDSKLIEPKIRIISSRLEEAKALDVNLGGYKVITLFKVLDWPDTNNDALISRVLKLIKPNGFIVVSIITPGNNSRLGQSLLFEKAEENGIKLVEVAKKPTGRPGELAVIYQAKPSVSPATNKLGRPMSTVSRIRGGERVKDNSSSPAKEIGEASLSLRPPQCMARLRSNSPVDVPAFFDGGREGILRVDGNGFIFDDMMAQRGEIFVFRHKEEVFYDIFKMRSFAVTKLSADGTEGFAGGFVYRRHNSARSAESFYGDPSSLKEYLGGFPVLVRGGYECAEGSV